VSQRQICPAPVDGVRRPPAPKCAEVRRYWPHLPESAMNPACRGIRPKLNGPDQAAADFRIDGPKKHGCDGVMQRFGLESPKPTSSMAIAEVVDAIIANGG
jgi:L-2-hydroxyglutarate oxidase LhgO